MITVNHLCSPTCRADGHPKQNRTITLPVSPAFTGLHWHAASGLTGYGPDAADGGVTTAHDVEGLADLIRDELSHWADNEHHTARAYADSGDYENAWKLREHSESIDVLCANLDNSRASAPLYADNRPAWHATIRQLVEDNFPYPVDEGRFRVHAWPCYMSRESCTIDPDEDQS